jgi:site-specific recombinase XerD
MIVIIDLLPAYQAALQARGTRTPKLVRSVLLVQKFAHWIGAVSVNQVTPLHISRYHAHLAYRHEAAFVWYSRHALRTFFQWALMEGVCQDNPTIRSNRSRKWN